MLDVGGVDGGSRVAVGMVEKVEMGWWSFYSIPKPGTSGKIAGQYLVCRPMADNHVFLDKKKNEN